MTVDKPRRESWKFSKEVVLAVLYKVYLVRQVISLVDTVQYSQGESRKERWLQSDYIETK